MIQHMKFEKDITITATPILETEQLSVQNEPVQTTFLNAEVKKGPARVEMPAQKKAVNKMSSDEVREELQRQEARYAINKEMAAEALEQMKKDDPEEYLALGTAMAELVGVRDAIARLEQEVENNKEEKAGLDPIIVLYDKLSEEYEEDEEATEPSEELIKATQAYNEIKPRWDELIKPIRALNTQRRQLCKVLDEVNTGLLNASMKILAPKEEKQNETKKPLVNKVEVKKAPEKKKYGAKPKSHAEILKELPELEAQYDANVLSMKETMGRLSAEKWDRYKQLKEEEAKINELRDKIEAQRAEFKERAEEIKKIKQIRSKYLAMEEDDENEEEISQTEEFLKDFEKATQAWEEVRDEWEKIDSQAQNLRMQERALHKSLEKMNEDLSALKEEARSWVSEKDLKVTEVTFRDKLKDEKVATPEVVEREETIREEPQEVIFDKKTWAEMEREILETDHALEDNVELEKWEKPPKFEKMTPAQKNSLSKKQRKEHITEYAKHSKRRGAVRKLLEQRRKLPQREIEATPTVMEQALRQNRIERREENQETVDIWKGIVNAYEVPMAVAGVRHYVAADISQMGKEEYRIMNAYLRADCDVKKMPKQLADGMTKELKKFVEQAVSGMKLIPLQQDKMVRRDVNYDIINRMLSTKSNEETDAVLDKFSREKGELIIEEKGFCSTTFDDQKYEDREMQFFILAHKGTNGIPIEGTDLENVGEKELLLAPGTKFRIIDAKKDGRGWKLYMETIPMERDGISK